ncbi:allantoinase AllB [Acidomonas methanolica]|uniref:allantoinase AllB n=1 Tax=Acidomonas methanolica TaxID=437 RepID=UPI00211A958F|nr:allantoinase AllB [Acidomonas methanolica]
MMAQQGPARADLVLKGGKVVSDRTIREADVAIANGLIVAVGTPESMPAAVGTLDVSGKHILPGAIDAHVHFRTPGYSYKEDWESGTAAAAMGGVTTVFEMPNTHPPTATAEALRQKLELASPAYVDYGLYGLLAEDNLEHIEDLITGGVAAFKCFMGNTFGNLPSPSTGAMLEGFELIAPHGLRISLHAETASIMARRQKRLEAAGRCDPLAHLASRPAIVAVEAVSRAAILAEWTGARIHVLHISSADELRVLREAKARGVDITGETCPHYLLFDEQAYRDLGSLIRVNPPVREKFHQIGLWQGLKDGTIDMIATDHAPHSTEEKIVENIWKADCGFVGVETQMMLMLSQVALGRLSLCDYVRLSATAPARAFGLYPSKGIIEVGADADIAVVDLDRPFEIREADLHSKGRVTPFEGMTGRGTPVHTLVRGRFVMRDRELVREAKGHGMSVRRIQRMPRPQPANLAQTMKHIVSV